jgi:hypothetical protein
MYLMQMWLSRNTDISQRDTSDIGTEEEALVQHCVPLLCALHVGIDLERRGVWCVSTD